MKILVPNHFPLEGSGSGIYTQNVARELTEAGHEVLVIAPDHFPVSGYPFEVDTILFKGPDNEKYDVPFNFPCFTTHPISNTTFYELDEGQIEAYVAAYRLATERAIEKLKPDLIHCQHCWVTPYCASEMDVPYIATAHGTDQMGFRKDGRYHDMVLKGVGGAERIIVISDQVRDAVEELYSPPPEKIVKVMNGFDEEVFNPMDVPIAEIAKKYGLPGGIETIISFVGKLTDFKGVDVLLDAAAIYEKELPRTATLIVGYGELDEELRAQASRLGLEKVFFLGQQRQKDVARVYASAAVSVVPSRVEPFGLVAIEAMACGTPVVATNAGGLPDFVTDDVGGLVEMENADALAGKIISEVAGGTKKTKGAHAAKYALDGFSWSGAVGKMISLYEEVV